MSGFIRKSALYFSDGKGGLDPRVIQKQILCLKIKREIDLKLLN